MRPNWFLAFPLDGRFVLDLPALPGRLRRFQPEDVHLTLAFLGAVGQEKAERTWQALDEALAAQPRAPVEVSLGGVVPMGGSRRSYTALSALLDRGREPMTQLLDALTNPMLIVAGGRPSARAPKPHVTLARPMRNASEQQRAEGLTWAESLSLGHVTQTLDRIALFTWADQRKDRLFKIVAERPLG
jgi:2'-5' RNA ligase